MKNPLRRKGLSGRRGSNPRHPAWEGRRRLSNTAKTRGKRNLSSSTRSHSFYNFEPFTRIPSRILSRHSTGHCLLLHSKAQPSQTSFHMAMRCPDFRDEFFEIEGSENAIQQRRLSHVKNSNAIWDAFHAETERCRFRRQASNPSQLASLRETSELTAPCSAAKLR